MAPPGSSPRVRGKRAGFPPCGGGCGLIPARAGKTEAARAAYRPGRAHPRACGENHWGIPVMSRAHGSSPRVRGKRHRRRRDIRRGRLIPARAGKTSRRPSRRPPWPAHPRACGENTHSTHSAPAPRGSSPRVRGKQVLWTGRNLVALLIPARAGKTGRCRLWAGRWRAHPRACGENQRTLRYPGFQAGSSPRVRGKPGPA